MKTTRKFPRNRPTHNRDGQPARQQSPQVLQLDPPISSSHLQAQIARGASLHKAGELLAATRLYVQILQLNPDCAEALTNLGVVCQDLGDLSLAAELHRRAIAVAPHVAEAHCNLGSVLSMQNHTEEALACYRSALALKPDYAGAHYNIGYILRQRGDLAAAEEYFQRALAFDPHSATLRFYLSVLHLTQGKFFPGWQEYESRWESPPLRAAKRNFTQPQWRGESLLGESPPGESLRGESLLGESLRGESLLGPTILLHAEQGLGDTIQFVRYAALVAARGGRVLLEVQPPLRRLMSGIEGVAQVICPGDPLPEFDWHCPLMSLPLALGTTFETIPAILPYLHIPEAAVHAQASRSWPTDGLRVGLAWAGSPTHVKDRNRSIPLSLLEPLLSIEGAHFFSLQLGSANEQLSAHTSIVDLAPAITDFADTAALILHLDLILAVDTSVAHLAGALNKPVWILLPFVADWRWLLDRDDSPWYPTARLFRKSGSDDWTAVIHRVHQELERLVTLQAPGLV